MTGKSDKDAQRSKVVLEREQRRAVQLRANLRRRKAKSKAETVEDAGSADPPAKVPRHT